MSTIGSVSGLQAYTPPVQAASRPAPAPPPAVARDADGDRDGSKTGEAEKNRPPVSATLGTRIDTTA